MATVVFYEKPGCGNNTRQKVWLAASGHTVLAKNLLTEKWSVARLLPFFAKLPVAQWFNPSAPRVKSGEVNPAALDAETALDMMLADPLLIRRPLMVVDGEFRVGFDADAARAWIGLNEAKPNGQDRFPHLNPLPAGDEINASLRDLNCIGDIEACPKGHNRFPHPCPPPSEAPLSNSLSETTSHSTRLQNTAAKSLVIPQAGERTNEKGNLQLLEEGDKVSLREDHDHA